MQKQKMVVKMAQGGDSRILLSAKYYYVIN
jgi:hypothetical protein